jgi:hypothetical protein
LLFLAEIVVGAIVPLVLFAIPKVRNTSTGLIAGSACVLAGVALNRTNVAVFAYEAPSGAAYFPHWMEILISVAAVAAGVLLFVLAVRYLPILPEAREGRSAAAPRLSRRVVVFGGGVLVLLALTVVLLLQPATQARAGRSQTEAVPSGVVSPREGECQTCHQDEQTLVNAGADQNDLDLYVIEPLPAEAVHGAIRCVTCHYGDRLAEDTELAHAGVVNDPTVGDAGVCVACHPELPDEFPEDRLRTPHSALTHGEAVDVSCSDCHGAVGHGFDPVSGETICPMGVCLDCHQERYLDSELSECGACHVGPHEPVPAFECTECHRSTDDWHVVQMTAHPVDLAGGHAQTECAGCHPDAGFDRVLGTKCADCHEPPNETHYGPACQDCHTLASFQGARLPDHPVTLVGYHKTAPCAGCHIDGQPAPEYSCECCHDRPENHLTGACALCHTPEGWAQSISWLVNLTPPISHEREGRESCLTCHDPAGEIMPAPCNHGDYANEQCVLCHK